MRVIGGGGVALHVVAEGNPDGPAILFIHGYCQSTFAWREQFSSDLARDFRLIAFDLRGHGESDKPGEGAAYAESQPWADDVAAVIAALELKNVTLVGWSYGGYVICDYLRFYGSDRVRAILLACALTVKGGEKARGFTGAQFAALFPALNSSDPEVLRPAMARFVDMCVADPARLPENDRVRLLAVGEQCPAVAREWMGRRKLDNDDVLKTLRIPVLCVHGTEDAIVTPASSQHNATVIPEARLSLYEGIGHTPFFEGSRRFNRELRELMT
ncbi:MAG TPA: alpha/beta hydrolase [Candidatus Baltobacteraceae bacterium]|jgi:pimeloyl-ACP methyl ester carboxylesterase